MESVSVAKVLLAARARARQLPPFSEASADFSVGQAYDVAAEILKIRRAAGEKPVGRKIGFTNRNIWREYGISALALGLCVRCHATHGA